MENFKVIGESVGAWVRRWQMLNCTEKLPHTASLVHAGFFIYYFANSELMNEIHNWCKASLEADEYMFIHYLHVGVIVLTREADFIGIKLNFSEHFDERNGVV